MIAMVNSMQDAPPNTKPKAVALSQHVARRVQTPATPPARLYFERRSDRGARFWTLHALFAERTQKVHHSTFEMDSFCTGGRRETTKEGLLVFRSADGLREAGTDECSPAMSRHLDGLISAGNASGADPRAAARPEQLDGGRALSLCALPLSIRIQAAQVRTRARHRARCAQQSMDARASAQRAVLSLFDASE